MDKRLEKALDFSNFRMILTTRQENLKLLMNNKSTISYEGGLFKITPELISFVNSLISLNEKDFIFMDINDIPIKVTDLSKFNETLVLQYKKALEQYYLNYQKLSEARDIRKVIDWDEEKHA